MEEKPKTVRELQTSRSSSLPYTHISNSIDRVEKILLDRKTGLEKSVRTGTPKLDKATLDGFLWNSVITLAGMSRSGKSLTLEQIKYGILENNPEEDIEVLSFEMEMLSTVQVLRRISAQTRKSISQLMSVGEAISDEELEAIKTLNKKARKYPVYSVDAIGDIDQIINTIIKFANDRKMKSTGKALVVTLDHVLLTKGKQGETEKKVVDNLYLAMMGLRKLFESNGMKILIILISQFNRNILAPDRILKSNLHFPNESDLFGASSIFMGSDIVIASHKPSLIPGINKYGPTEMPITNPENPGQKMIYWHIIKNRFGSEKILMMLDDFKNSRILEYYPPNKANKM